MRVLIIEDEKKIAQGLKKTFEAELFAVDLAYDGDVGATCALINDYDIIIVDYRLPNKNGFEICKTIRDAGKQVPILMLSVETEQALKVNLLNAGADDYMSKPFSTEELIARVRALLRRPPITIDSILTIDDLVCDPQKYCITRANKEIYLTRKEFGLLEYMLRNQDIALSRAMIMEHVWDEQVNAFSNTIESHILNLRKKIDKGHGVKLIHTLPGRGYILGVRSS